MLAVAGVQSMSFILVLRIPVIYESYHLHHTWCSFFRLKAHLDCIFLLRSIIVEVFKRDSGERKIVVNVRTQGSRGGYG